MANKVKRSKFAPSEESVDKSPYVGRAGEMFVLAEMLIRQHNASILPIDQGIDIVSTHKGKHVTVQVKARTLSGESASKWSIIIISKQAWTRKRQPDYFVFVGFLDDKPYFFVYTHKDVRNLFTRNIFVHKPRHKRYEAIFIFNEGRWFLKNMKDPANDITDRLNDWSYLE